MVFIFLGRFHRTGDDEQPNHNRHWACCFLGMDIGLEKIASETTTGMSQQEKLAVAEEFESVARIIRQQACGACEFCLHPACWRRGLWRN